MHSEVGNLRRFALTLLYGNVAVFGILLATVIFALTESHNALAELARQTSENLAHTLSLSIGTEVKQIDNALLSVVQKVDQLNADAGSDMRKMSTIIDEQRILVPQVDDIWIANAEGAVLSSTGQAPISVADRDYFLAARCSPHGLVISEPLQSRITGKWGVVLARPRTDANGRFLGIVFSNLGAAHLVDELDDVSLGPHGAVTLRSGSLRLIARYTPGRTNRNAGLGTSNVSSELRFALASDADHGSFVSRTAVDGIERINAYERIPGYQLLLLVGLGSGDFYAPWKREVAEMAALALLLEFTAIWSSLRIYRQQTRQVRSHTESVRLAAEREAMLDNDLVGMVKLRDRAEVWHNKAFATVFGYNPGELTAQPLRLLYPDDEHYERIGQAGADLVENEHYRTQLQMVRKDGRLIWVDLSGAKLPGGEFLWLVLDITRVKESEVEARHLATHDALTGLANRVKLIDDLGQKMREAQERGRRLAVCYVDLDGFKGVNDTHGHEAGDRLLKVAAQRMASAVRSGDLVARLGGDEFVAVLCDLPDETEVPNVLQRLIESLTAPIAVRDGAEAVISASIGVALFPRHDERAERLLFLADEQMYAAKRAGKNRFVVHPD